MSRRQITDQELQKAASALRSAMLDPLPREPEGQFSAEFDQKMAELTKVRKRHEKLLQYRRQLAAAMIAYILSVGAFFTLHTDAQAAANPWLTEEFDTHTIFWFSGEKPTELPMFEPSAVPTEYECVYDETLTNSRTMLYLDPEDETNGFTFSYGFAQSDAPLTVDHPDSIVEDVTVGGSPGKLYISSDPEESHALVWVDESTDIVFSITSYLDPEVMLHIAESVELVK